MEFIIVISVVVALVWLGEKAKNTRPHTNLAKIHSDKNRSATKRNDTRQMDEELITVILPTINNDNNT